MSETVTYTVPAMSCGHCRHAVSEELSAVRGAASLGVDLETKVVVVHGEGLEDRTLRSAIVEAGYEAA